MKLGTLNEYKYDETFCSQCGKDLGPGDSGVSHCRDHMKPEDYNEMMTDRWGPDWDEDEEPYKRYPHASQEEEETGSYDKYIVVGGRGEGVPEEKIAYSIAKQLRSPEDGVHAQAGIGREGWFVHVVINK